MKGERWENSFFKHPNHRPHCGRWKNYSGWVGVKLIGGCVFQVHIKKLFCQGEKLVVEYLGTLKKKKSSLKHVFWAPGIKYLNL